MGSKYIFIHPTKCGGTAVANYFRDHYSDFIIGGHEHATKCQSNNSIIIVREPYDRFISMYYYWKNGSIDGPFQRSQEFIEQFKEVGIKDFINILKDPELSQRNLFHGFTWIQHFLPTVEWIGNVNLKEIIVIKYDKDLNNSINKLIDRLEIPNKNVVLPFENVSKKEDKIILDQTDRKDIYNLFYKDFLLWKEINKHPEKFRLVL